MPAGTSGRRAGVRWLPPGAARYAELDLITMLELPEPRVSPESFVGDAASSHHLYLCIQSC